MTRRSPTAPPRPLSSTRRGALALLALVAACAQAPTAPPPPDPPRAPSASPAPTASGVALEPGLKRLDEALALRRRSDQWEEVRPVALEAAGLISAARSSARPDPRADAALEAAQALADWQALSEAGWSLQDADPQSWFQARQAGANALLRLLALHGGRLPQTQTVSALILLDSARGPEAAQELQAALRLFPADAELHQLMRANRDALPDPYALALQAQQAAAQHPDARAQCLATSGELLLAAGLRAQESGDVDGAITQYEQGAANLLLAQQAPHPQLSDWELLQARNDCLVNAASLHLQRAASQLGDVGLEAVRPDMLRAEEQFGDAFAARPDDTDAHDGLAATADLYYQAGDMPGARDAFARVAERFDDAEWWNNAAFLCRETEEYERSYAAYERCIALEPDNARYVNDTGLILLYHLDRDLPHAEELFRRSIDLGQATCANPFIEEDARANNFSAYTDAMLNLSLLMARDGRLDEAASLVNDLLALAPDRPDAQQLRDDIQAARAGNPLPGGR